MEIVAPGAWVAQHDLSTLIERDYVDQVQNRRFALDRLFPLPAVGLGDYVEGCALHTSRMSIKYQRWS